MVKSTLKSDPIKLLDPKKNRQQLNRREMDGRSSVDSGRGTSLT